MGKKRRKKSGHAPTSSPPQHPRPRLTVRARAFVFGIAPVLALMMVVRIALAEPYHIPSGSMVPTLLEGDWLYVNKLRYGPHVPFTHINLPGYAQPERRDVVVFVSPPQDPEIRITPRDITPMLVKRIVGVSGDTLYMRGGSLFVNGVREDRDSVSSAEPYAPPELLARQHLIEIHGSRFGEPPAKLTLHEWGPLVVPRNAYFMLGDNRDSSVDSRFYGPVPRENIRGKPMFVYYSYNTTDGTAYLRALTEIRWKRIGALIR